MERARIEKNSLFVHQNLERESPLLTAHFIEQLNLTLGTQLNIPNKDVHAQTRLL